MNKLLGVVLYSLLFLSPCVFWLVHGFTCVVVACGLLWLLVAVDTCSTNLNFIGVEFGSLPNSQQLAPTVGQGEKFVK